MWFELVKCQGQLGIWSLYTLSSERKKFFFSTSCFRWTFWLLATSCEIRFFPPYSGLHFVHPSSTISPLIASSFTSSWTPSAPFFSSPTIYISINAAVTRLQWLVPGFRGWKMVKKNKKKTKLRGSLHVHEPSAESRVVQRIEYSGNWKNDLFHIHSLATTVQKATAQQPLSSFPAVG